MVTKSFHSLVDRYQRAYQNFTGGGWVGGTYISFLNRSITYEFFSPFHPYVGSNRTGLANVPSSSLSLIRCLNEGGVKELLESNTLYQPQPTSPVDQPLNVIADSTRVLLSQQVSGTRPDGSSVTLYAGTPLTLKDG